MKNQTLIRDDQESFFYNLRFMLIVCVLAGNALEPLITRFAGAEALFLWIYTFHMPLFVWVTGYFAIHSLQGESGRNVLKQIALQYVLFQSLYALMDFTIFHTPHMRLSFFAPYLLLWFLASHFCWRLLLRLTISWKPIYRLIGSIALGVIAGYLPIDGFWLSFSRTFVFLPFFVIGYDYGATIRSRLLSGWGRKTAPILSAALLVWIGYGGLNISSGWLLGSMTYAELGHHEWYAGIFRVGVYLLEIASADTVLGLGTFLDFQTDGPWTTHTLCVPAAWVSRSSRDLVRSLQLYGKLGVYSSHTGHCRTLCSHTSSAGCTSHVQTRN